MPDWTYQTVFRPALFRLRPELGRGLALGAMGRLARLPLGTRVIQFMGHMSPDPRLTVERNGLKFATPVGLGSSFDSELTATPALAEFGFGFLEIGPVASRSTAAGSIEMDVGQKTIRLTAPQGALAASTARQSLERDGPFHLPIFARVEPDSSEDAQAIINELGSAVDGYFVPIDCLENVSTAFASSTGVATNHMRLFAVVNAAEWNEETQSRCVRAAADESIAGVVVAAGIEPDGSRQLGTKNQADALAMLRQVRTAIGPQPFVINSFGVHTPADALDCIEAGANLVQVDSGLVFSGPGLPKRINETLLYRKLAIEEATDSDSQLEPSRVGGESWFWAFLMGLSMLIGGLMAIVIGATRVVMPYDEMSSGLSREQLAQINDRVLPFMTHDRVTLAGTMLALGILYVTFAVWGIRRGVHWAYVSVLVSAMAGFISFFSFLGFGYFDPFHAFVTAILFQFLLLTMHAHLPLRDRMEPPDLWNDGRWLANQWGQLLFVVHGVVLVVAGLVISKVGMTTVFVPEDLEFMRTTAEQLTGAHPQLVPLVAHDRATFGGMLISCGMATFLPALWGFRRGQAWLWWALMLGGNVAYWSTMLVHWIVGYDSLMHLLPAYGGLALLWLGGALSYRFLAASDSALEEEWQRRLDRN